MAKYINKRKQLEQLLSKTGGFTVDELHRRLDVPKSTIYEWIDELRDMGADIPQGKRGIKTRYYFLRPFAGFSSETGIALTRPMEIIMQFLDSYRGNPMMTEVRSMIAKKIREFSAGKDEWADNDQYVFFETPPLRKGHDLLPVILKAILRKNILSFDYDSYYDGVIKPKQLKPCFLKEHNGMWYVFGHSVNHGNEVMYACDRISNIVIDKNSRFERPDISYKKKFDEVFGLVTTDAPLTNVRLQFTRNTGDFILTRPLHKSQTLVKKTDAFIEVSLKIRIDKNDYIQQRELIRELCKWGRDVKVLEPDFLVKEIQVHLTEALKQYQ